MPMEKAFLLIGELPGANGDFHPRPTVPLLCSSSKEALQEWWKRQPKPTPEETPLSLYPDEGDDPRYIRLLDYSAVFINSVVVHMPYLTAEEILDEDKVKSYRREI